MDKAETTKAKLAEIILKQLSQEFPLKTKDIYKRISRETTVTYQGVHKALKQLSAEGKITKKGAEYKLSDSWISTQADFFEKTQKKYGGNDRPSMLEIPPNSSVTVEFNESWVAPAYWLLDEMLAYSHAKKVKGTSFILMDGV